VSERPFNVLGLQQIAVGAIDKAPLRKIWIDMLGLEPTGDFVSESENVDEDIAVAGSGPLKVEVDLMVPLDPEKRPKVHEPALNHVGLWIDDLAAAVTWLEGNGVRFTPGGIRKGASGFDVCFIHPKGNDASPIGDVSLAFGWMKQTSCPAAPARIPPGVKRTPFSSSHVTAAARSSIHNPTWLSAGSCTFGFPSGSIGCIRSTSTLNGPRPATAMSSSTFSFSLL
jgi:lactoylglutathione lyase